jgi:hypothetical protein
MVVELHVTTAEPLNVAAATDGLFYLAFFGLPIAYATELLIYWLGFRALAHRGPFAVIATSMCGGIAVASLLGLDVARSWLPDPVALLEGAFSGLAAGFTFWLIGLWRSPPSRSAT